jgi:hypothetical protein
MLFQQNVLYESPIFFSLPLLEAIKIRVIFVRYADGVEPISICAWITNRCIVRSRQFAQFIDVFALLKIPVFGKHE